jgi:hypothetical protein
MAQSNILIKRISAGPDRAGGERRAPFFVLLLLCVYLQSDLVSSSSFSLSLSLFSALSVCDSLSKVHGKRVEAAAAARPARPEDHTASTFLRCLFLSLCVLLVEKHTEDRYIL